MPAYNFQQRFVFPILLGTKPHTIRRRRKHATEPGDTIMMYTGLRTKKACKFGESPCIKVEPIIIYPWKKEVLKADHNGVFGWMDDDEVGDLAHRDGFRFTDQFFDFFQRYEQDMLDDFEIVWWDPRRVVIAPGVRMVRASALAPAPVMGAKLEAIVDWEERRKR